MTVWYAHLKKPGWTAPEWLYGPAWTALYIAMGIAAWRVWTQHGLHGARLALGLFAAQLALNALWVPAFFGLQSVVLGLIVASLLTVAVLATTIAFARRSRLATVLMVPYLLWVTYATALNFRIWQLN